MNNIKVIKNQKDYEDALKHIEALMDRSPDHESEEDEQLSLLVALVRDYESRVYPIDLPDPIEAIKFKMTQKGLKPADLIPYIGSRSRVSEILSGKRPLTLEMVRALESGLGIPAKVLIRKPEIGINLEYQDWDNRLVEEMQERGYFGRAKLNKNNKVTLLDVFFGVANTPTPMVAMLRQSSNYRTSPLTDRRALAAWATQVLNKAKSVKGVKKYEHGTVDLAFMQQLVKLSAKDNSPVLAQTYLKKHGIILVIEPHFRKTYLDGAAILLNKDNPVIGLTIRYNRLDNFWFTLMHELAHISKHYNSGFSFFYDEIEDVKAAEINSKEKEADVLAQESLLPNAKWEVSPARLIPSSMAASSLANELGVHVAIIAGQIRYKGGKYVYLNKIVNGAKVRQYFPDIKWNNN